MKEHIALRQRFFKPVVIGCLFLFGCEEPNLKTRKFDFIVIDKISLKNERNGIDYFLKSKDTTITCGTYDFASCQIGDTLKLEIPQDGFYEGTVCRVK